MCGWVAVIGIEDQPTRGLVEHMRDQLAHRGPDGKGFWQGGSGNCHVSFGFRWLSIVDRNESSNQPLISHDSSCVLVFNGEVYNFVELREQLKKLSHVFKTNGDAEVLLAGYKQWGRDVVYHLNGMFSFAIWDNVLCELFVARDRFGEKPLFYTKLPNGNLVFASEMKAILVHPQADPSYRQNAFKDFSDGKINFAQDETIFSSIFQIKPSHFMRISKKKGEILGSEPYWKPRYTGSVRKTKQSLEELEYKLISSLKLRMRTDTPVASTLSGGLDSSLIVGMLNSHQTSFQTQRIKDTFSVKFPKHPEIDESSFIDLVTNQVKFKNNSITPTANNLLRDFRKLHWHHEVVIPGASMYLEWSLMNYVKSLGYKVLLDGQGGDEVFAGYASYFHAYQTEQFGNVFSGLLRSLKETQLRDAHLSEALRNFNDPTSRVGSSDSYGILDIVKNKLKWSPQKETVYGSPHLPTVAEIGHLRFELALNLLKTSLPSNLTSGDRNAMAYGVEARYPYLDYELIDFALDFSDEMYFEDGWSKSCLRDIADNYLSKDISRRADKVGFAPPISNWMKQKEIIDWVEERLSDPSMINELGEDPIMTKNMLIEHRSGVIDHSNQIWKLASFSELVEMQKLGYWKEKYQPKPPEIITAKDNKSGKIQFTYEWFNLGERARFTKKTSDKNVWIISYTPIAHEARVLRQAQAMYKTGYNVYIFGNDAKIDVPPSFNFICLEPNSSIFKGGKGKATTILGLLISYANGFVRNFSNLTKLFLRRFLKLLIAILPHGIINQMLAIVIGKLTRPFKDKSDTIESFYNSYPEHRPDLILCHDYFTLDIATKISKKVSVPLSVDCHEFSSGQWPENKFWMKTTGKFIKAWLDFYLSKVSVVTTVSDGIAEAMKKHHNIDVPINVIRSAAFSQNLDVRPTQKNVRVLYHGEIFPTRGIHIIVGSLASWRENITLTLRGNVSVEYKRELEAIAADQGCAHRLFFEEAVPFNELIKEANKFDVGIFVQSDQGIQRKYALPNKFFEYIMASLALVTSDLPEISAIVNEHKNGRLVKNLDEASIASVINSLTVEEIDEMKKNSNRLSRVLNWETESKRMIAAYEGMWT